MDILRDPGYIRLLTIKTAHPTLMPEYVVEADLQQIKTAAADFANSMFADEISRQFPIGDKAQIWLAAAYLTKSARDLQLSQLRREEIEERIKYAADLFGIREDVDKVIAVLGEEKRAEAEEHWGYVNGTEKKYPLHTADLVKRACDYFETNRDKYPFAMRRTIAANIFKRAQTLAIEPSDTIRKEAGVGYPDRAAAVAALEDRSQRIREKLPEQSQQLASLSTEIKLADADQLMTVVDSAIPAVELLDKEAGFHYGTPGKDPVLRVSRPVNWFYGIAPKTAEHYCATVVELGGELVDCEKLAEALDVSALDTPMGPDFLKTAFAALPDFDKLSAGEALQRVLSQLPASDKTAVARFLTTL